jgi:integrase
MARLGNALIKALKYNGKEYRVWDDSPKGFGLCVHKDSISYIIQYRNQYGRQRLLTIGRVDKISLEKARKLAREKFADIAHGEDPAAQRKDDKQTMTVGEMCDWYMANGTAHKRPSTVLNDRGAIERHIKPLIGGLSIKEVNREIIEKFVHNITTGEGIRRKEKGPKLRGRIYVKGGESAARHTLVFLGTIFNYAIANGKLDKNPCKGVKRAPDRKKEVYLTIDEIREFGRLLANPKVIPERKTAVDAIKLLLFTGCRRGEVLGLKWDFIDFDKQFFNFPITKTTQKQTRSFGIAALHLLQELYKSRDVKSPYVFPSTKECKDGHLSGAGLYKAFLTILATKDNNENLIFRKDRFDLHSLRHTYASMGEYLQISPLLVGGILGHKTNAFGITGRYIHTANKDLQIAANRISSAINEALCASGAGDVKGNQICLPQPQEQHHNAQ